MTRRTTPFCPEVRERAVWMVRDHEGEHGSQWSAIQSIAAKIGCSGETLRNWMRQSERDQGVRPGRTTHERERIKALERENRELRQADETRNIGSEGGTNQNVPSAWEATRSTSPVSCHSHIIPSTETKGREAVRPPKL